MNNFRDRVRANELECREAFPTQRGAQTVAAMVFLLLIGFYMMWFTVRTDPKLISFMGMCLILSVVMILGVLGCAFLMPKERESLVHWWYRNFLGCYAFYRLDESGAVVTSFGRGLKCPKTSEPFISCQLLLAIRLGGWIRRRQVVAVYGEKLLPSWKMTRADSLGEYLCLTDKDLVVAGVAGRIFLVTVQLLAAVNQQKLPVHTRAGLWHEALQRQLQASEKTRLELEELVIDVIVQIRSTTRLFHSKEGFAIRLHALHQLRKILPGSHPVRQAIDEQIREAEDEKTRRAAARRPNKPSRSAETSVAETS